MESAAMDMRPPSKTFRLSTKPSFFFPSICAGASRQFSKITSPVALARRPSLFSFLPQRQPGVPFSMMKAEIPCCAAARSVTAMATQTSA